MTATVAYDPWGVPVAGPADDPFGYKGQAGYYTDTATGLILCTHRYYDPELGRWLTRDPIGYEGGVNLYGYCGNEPVGRVDPDGLRPRGTEWDGACGLLDGIYQAFVLGTLDQASLQISVGPMQFWRWNPLLDKAEGFSPSAAMAEWGGDVDRDSVYYQTHNIAGLLTPLLLAKGGPRGIRGRPVVVIGENMDRVTPYATAIGAKTYKGLPLYKLLERILGANTTNRLGMWHNKRWIQGMVRKGADIIDVGPDFARRFNEKRISPAYEMERHLTKGYIHYRKVFVRFGKARGGVAGIDY